MPWNDLYGTQESRFPDEVLTPLAVKMQWKLSSAEEASLADRTRKYMAVNILGALIHINTLYWASNEARDGIILHFHSPILGLLAAAIKITCPGIKIVATQHNAWDQFRLHQRLGIAILAMLSERFISCGNAIVETIPKRVRKALEDRGALVVIPNGIPGEELKRYEWEAANTCNQVQESAPAQAVVIARMIPQKNCFFLLDVIAKCAAVDNVIWFGDGYLRPHIEGEIQRRGLEHKFELRGRRPRGEVLSSLAGSAMYIACSKWEGLSVADLEAVALGCWPFFSDIPQREEIAETLELDTYPLSDASSWVEAIEEHLALSAGTRKQMRDQIANRARSAYDLKTTVDRYMEIYRSLI